MSKTPTLIYQVLHWYDEETLYDAGKIFSSYEPALAHLKYLQRKHPDYLFTIETQVLC